MKNNLLSIGEVANISDVHINSLRYYDKLGILKPAYVDPETNYRYYTYSQIGIVSAIQACVELGIPLKEYMNFTENGGQTIHMEQLLEYGKEQSEKRIHSIRNGLKQIELMQKEIAHSKRLLANSGQPILYDLPKKKYFTVPIKGNLTEEDYRSLEKIHLIAMEKGYKVDWEVGLLYLYHAETVERYRFIEIVPGSKDKGKNIITVPAGRYIAKGIKRDGVENALNEFPHQFEQEYTKIVIASELFTGNLDLNNPLYELRCSL